MEENKKLKKYKVGIDSETYAISLVEEPAIEETLVYLNKEEEKKVEVCLEADEKHMVYSAVLVPDKPIYRYDDYGEFYVEFTKESIEKMSQEFMLNYRQKDITIGHQEEATEVAVVESWVKYSPTMDKSVALGLNADLPVGTWFVGMKINNIATWEMIKNGELRGYSVEALVDLQEFDFNKQDEHMNKNLFSEMKRAFKEALQEEKLSFKDKKEAKELKETQEEIAKIDEEIKVDNIKLEEETATATETVTETPTVENQTIETPVEEPKVETQTIETPVEETKPVEEPKVEEPKIEHNPLEEVVNNLRSEIETLRKMNETLQAKVEDLNKQPSTPPINTNSGNGGNSTFQSWREQMRNML